MRMPWPAGVSERMSTSFNIFHTTTYRRPAASNTPWLRHALCVPALQAPRALVRCCAHTRITQRRKRLCWPVLIEGEDGMCRVQGKAARAAHEVRAGVGRGDAARELSHELVGALGHIVHGYAPPARTVSP